MDVCPIFRKAYDVCKLVPPLKPLEIMSHGKAIIVSDLLPLTEIVGDEIDGLVCQSENPDELARAIVKLYKDKHLRLKLGDNAQKKIQSTYNWPKNARLYKNVYTGKTRFL
jgi:glycosyltransferase involved in cell wall biosynthesis